MTDFYRSAKLIEFMPASFECLYRGINSFLLSIVKIIFNKIVLSASGFFFILIVFLGLTTLSSQTFAQTPPSGFLSTTIMDGWDGAVGLTFSKDGKLMFVWEKGGKVWVVKNGVKTLVLDISPEVGNWHDHGMLGFALHPNFDVNGYFYVSYVVERHHLLYYGQPSYDQTVTLDFKATIGRLTRYTAIKNGNGDYVANLSSRKILLGETRSTGIPVLSKTHGVGTLVFGTDGTLLMSAGEGASPSATDGGGAVNGSYATQALADGIITSKEDIGAFRSQSLESLSGKILRIDPETGNGIPSNPFYQAASPKSVRSRVWALGLRNPFRVILKPGTGSTDPAAGNPGILYVGDVGFVQWEELNVVKSKGMNFGWPLYEGLQLNAAYSTFPAYNSLNVANPYAPNPLYGSNACTQQYFKFSDLLKQESQTTPTFKNPCNTSQDIPASINRFMHTRPIIDWKHGTVGPSRVGIFKNGVADVINIGAAGSPVTGSQFGGNSATAGIFYTGNDFPAAYKNTFFFGDYSKGWIRAMSLDANHKPTAVKDFIATGARVVAMAIHPLEDGFYYIHYDDTGSEVRKLFYGTTAAPVAVASVDKNYGAGPLTVQFTGSNSHDPENLSLSYEWNFGDGTPISIAVNPSHVYAKGAGTPVKYNVTLKVTNSHGISATNTSLFVSVNNTPPVVNITSPVNNTYYSINQETLYTLKATVTDAQHSGTGLSYQWQTVQHHEDHTHPGPIDTKVETTSLLVPEANCEGETFFFVVTLKVTDAAGLATTQNVTLYPDCAAPISNVTNLVPTGADSQVQLNWTNPSNLDEIIIVAKAGAGITASPTGNGSTYIANLNFTGNGSSFDGGKVVYKGTASPKTVIGLTNGTNYFFKVFTRKGSSWSTGSQVNAIPNALVVANVTNFAAIGGNAEAQLNWTNPSNLDEIMIVAKAGAGITASPTGNGSTYIANLNFTGNGSSFDGGKVVYKGTASPKTVIGLTNGTNYFFKVFTRKGSSWSTGSQVNAIPTDGGGGNGIVSALWDKTFGGSSTENFTTAIQTTDGGYLLGGSSSSGISGDKSESGRGGEDYWIIKINSDGDKQWNKRFGGTGAEFINSAIQTTDGGYLLAGTSTSGAGGDKSESSRGDRDYWVVKVNSAGTKLWDKRFGGAKFDDLRKVITTTDGGYLLCGYSNSVAGGDKTEGNYGGYDYWVVKINSSGAKLWDKRFGGTADDKSKTVIATADGGFLLGGNSASGVNGNKTEASRGGLDYWVVKINSSGTKVWDKRFGGTLDEYQNAVIATTDGGFLLGGNAFSEIGGDKTESGRGSGDYWVVKINSSGVKLWDKRFGSSANDDLQALVTTIDGGYILGGYLNSDINGDKTESNRGEFDYWILKIDAAGVKQWDKRFGGSLTESLLSLIKTSDGGYLLGGKSNSNTSGDKTENSKGGIDFWVVKTDGGASLSSLQKLTATNYDDLNLAESQVNTKNALVAQPNPFSDKVTISFKLPNKQEVNLQIFDTQGVLVATLFTGVAQENKSYTFELGSKTLKEGVYFARLGTSKNISHLKLVVVK